MQATAGIKEKPLAFLASRRVGGGVRRPYHKSLSRGQTGQRNDSADTRTRPYLDLPLRQESGRHLCALEESRALVYAAPCERSHCTRAFRPRPELIVSHQHQSVSFDPSTFLFGSSYTVAPFGIPTSFSLFLPPKTKRQIIPYTFLP